MEMRGKGMDVPCGESSFFEFSWRCISSGIELDTVLDMELVRLSTSSDSPPFPEEECPFHCVMKAKGDGLSVL